MTDLVVTGLHLAYGDVAVLKGVSLTLKPGEVVALLGASGSGKTSLLRAIAGLEMPQSGQIRLGHQIFFDGARQVRMPAERRNLGLVFQSYALWPHRTVYGNVAFPLQLRGIAGQEARRRVDQALAQLGLDGLADRHPHQLSGGQQQRVAIARALVYGPPVILLDEPLSNLDAKLREEARLWLRRLITDLGLSAICVTHDQMEAMAIADRILLLNHGRIEQQGTPQAIYGAPDSLMAAEFMGTNNRLTGRITRLDEGYARLELGAGRSLVGRLRGAAADSLADGAAAIGVIRVDRIAVGTEARANSLELPLTTRLYLGERWEMLCEADGLTVRAYAPAAPADGRHVLHFPPDALWLFAD